MQIPLVAKDDCQNRKIGTTEGERSGSQFRSFALVDVQALSL